MMLERIGKIILGVTLFHLSSALGDEPAYVNTPNAETAQWQVSGNAPPKPFRTFITIQRYNMESNGEPGNPISNVRLEITFPNGVKLNLPEGGPYWPIGNLQVQEINRTFEVPWPYLVSDAFKFTIQMVRKGSSMLPCQFDVVQLSQFNRSYVCSTDVAWQQNQNVPPEKLDKEGIQIRIFTSLNSAPSEIPSDAIALK